MNTTLDKYRELNQKYRVLGMTWQMLMSVSWLLLAFILALCFPASPWKWLCFAGMLLSLCGDIFLTPNSVFGKVIPGDLFWYGGTAFGVAHILYAAAFMLKTFSVVEHISLWAWLGGALLYLVAVAGLTWQHLHNKNRNRKLFWGILFYSLLICFDCAMVIGAVFAFGTFGSVISLIGIFSFYISDAILLCGKVGATQVAHYDEWIWVFYPIGQLLLILGA